MSPTQQAFPTYEAYRDEMMHESNPYKAAISNTAQGARIGDSVLAAWSARLALELLVARHASTKEEIDGE